MTVLANHLWQSSLVLIAVWALTTLLRHHRAAVRHRLWLFGVVKFALPFDVLVEVGRRFGSGLPGLTSSPMTLVVEVVSEPFSHPAIVAAARVVNTTAPSSDEIGPGLLLMLVWAGGATVAVMPWVREWLRIAWQVRSAIDEPDASLRASLAQALARHPHPVEVRLVECDSRIEPGIFGIVTPVLLWPRALTRRLSRAETEAVLAHELWHVSRRDNLTDALHTAISVVFWFYPVLRLIGRQLRVERERACDEAVLERGYSRVTYAESIVKTCEFCVPTLALAGATGSLRTRVGIILRGHAARILSGWHRLALTGAAIGSVLAPLVFGLVTAPHLRAQAPAAPGGTPAFEVASVKRNTEGSDARLFQALPGGRVNLLNLSLRELIFRAYQTQDYLVVGAPSWAGDEHFDVVAKAADNVPPGQMLVMVRQLLADRFKLVMHRERRDMPIYHLVASDPGRMGPGLMATTCVQGQPGVPPRTERDAQGRYACGVNGFGPGEILLTGNTLDALANRLGSQPGIGRSVVNRTGREGRFDIVLSFTPGLAEPSADGVSVFTALEEQLGLRLEGARGPVEVFVVDSVERPTPD